MTQPKTNLAYLRSEKAKAEQKLRSCQHREKILERRMSELNRRERVHRLCTRAGMLESFLVCPGELTAELMDKVSRLYDELISYADLYDSANFEAKKMVVNQLIRRVDVYRGYQINISFNFDLTPYIEGE